MSMKLSEIACSVNPERLNSAGLCTQTIEMLTILVTVLGAAVSGHYDGIICGSLYPKQRVQMYLLHFNGLPELSSDGKQSI